SGYSGIGGTFINVKTYGAKGDAITVLNAAITTGTANMTSPTTFVAGDVGKTIMVRGAGAAGATLETTILSVAAGVATLNTNAGTTVSGQRADYGTLDIAAVNAAIAALPSTGGTIYFPAKKYMLGQSGNSASTRMVLGNGNVTVRGDGMGQSTLLYSSAGRNGGTGPGTLIFIGNISTASSYGSVVDLTIRDL